MKEQFEKFTGNLLKAIDFALGDSSLRVRYKLMEESQIQEEIQHSPSLQIIQKIQSIKQQMDENVIPQDVATELSKICGLLKNRRLRLIRNEKILLFLELARLSLRLNCVSVAASCINELKNYKIQDLGKQIELDCLECDFEVQKLGPKIPTYAKSVVEAQLKVIQKMELILNRAIRLKDPNVIQAVCTTQWNLCLPLLQDNLQHHVRKPLLAIAEILEKIDSMLILLRCQVHMEIARIEEKGERIEPAMEHFKKALDLDNNGQYNEYLKMAFHRLSVNTTLYKPVVRLEDQASLMVEQAKKGTDKDSVRKKRSLLVNAGLALAPEAFQIVLDSENEAKVASSKSKGQISYLCAKVEHHTRNVEKADGHLKRLGRENEKERIKLWSEIAKTARKQSVWDVCRAACRFCLLYDDSQLPKESKHTKRKKKTSVITLEDTLDHEISAQTESPLSVRLFSLSRDLHRTLAEVRFINAEATIQLLRMEGVRLNDRAIMPADTSQHPLGHSLHQHWNDSEWNTYSNWITRLSKYAMENFLRAAKIGEELNEAWIVHNAVVYVLNHNKHLIASRRQREIVESLNFLFTTIRTTGHCGNTAILVALCNALARGLILPWIPKPVVKIDEKKVIEEGPTKRKKAAKVHEKPASGPTLSVDPAGVPDIRAAIEVCDYAMNLPDGNFPEEPVPIALRQEIIATWVKAKQLVQQQIASKHLEKMTSECNWTDPMVHLQTLTRLTHFAQTTHDHELVMACAQKALELEDEEQYNTEAKKKGMSDYMLRNEMLSIAACAQGKSLMENLAGKKHLRLVASNSFVKSAWYAGEAENLGLAMIAARHFWNACLPFIASSVDRQQLKKPTEIILKSIMKAAEAKNKQDPEHMIYLHQWPTAEFQSSSSSDGHFYPGADEDLTLRTFLYVLLFQVYADKNDWEAGLKVLDEAVQLLPRTKHRLPIFKHLIMVKARLGRNYIMEIQKFKDESEDYLSSMWHRLAFVSTDLVGQLSCYQNAIAVLQKKESELKKVDNILGFAEWLYCNQFPLSDSIKHLDWAISILLHLIPSRRSHDENDSNHQITTEDFKSIKQLEALVRAHTLMAVISGHGSPSHQHHCLMAYAYVIRIWQTSPTSPTPKDRSSKDKSPKSLRQMQSFVKERPKRKGPIDALPANVEEWANYDCPEEIRDAFKQDPTGYALNRDNVVAPEMNDLCAVSRCLYLLAVLANLEKNHRQSKVLIEKAQLIGGSEQFWHRSTMCLTDAILGQDKEEEDKMVEVKPCIEKSPSPEAEEKSEEVKVPSNSLPLSKKQVQEYKRKANEFKRRQSWNQKYLFQSNEVLLQCINFALNNNMLDILASASLEMVEYFGRIDPLSASQFLALHQAWGNLSISTQHFNIMNELPPNFHVIILQHSEDRSLLYGAVIEKIKLPNPKDQKEKKEKGGHQKEKSGQQKEKSEQKKEKQKGKPAQPTLQAKIMRSPVDSVMFTNLLEKNSEYENEQYFAAEFQDITKAMEEYLKPVLSLFDFSELRPPTPAVSPVDSGKTKTGDSGKSKRSSSPKAKAGDTGKSKVAETGKSKTKLKDKNVTAQAGTEDMGECMILLADKFLMELPLESLNIFQEEVITSVTRDFSLQLFYNRLHKEEPDNEGKRDSKGAKDSKPKGDRKGMKPVNLNRVLLPNCIAIDINNVKYVVDPYNDVKGTDCQLMILSELVHSKSSYVRVANLDLDKSSLRLSLEMPTETAIILSLIGVRCIIANQWYSLPEENGTRLESLCENLLKVGKTTGQAIRILHRSKTIVEESPELLKVEGDHLESPEEKKEDQKESPRKLTHYLIHPPAFNTVLYGLPNMMFA
ncbi:hypothetical protein lerEdw1_007720 [Lerista edwardsae]|nr:hypothetical protein lerEdw1_007720 [Lerista edwardsae]